MRPFISENLRRYGQEPKRLSEDHCHYTDADRALLCQRCNRVLGMLWNENRPHGDSAELPFRMLEYLRHFCGAKFGNPHHIGSHQTSPRLQGPGPSPRQLPVHSLRHLRQAFGFKRFQPVSRSDHQIVLRRLDRQATRKPLLNCPFSVSNQSRKFSRIGFQNRLRVKTGPHVGLCHRWTPLFLDTLPQLAVRVPNFDPLFGWVYRLRDSRRRPSSTRTCTSVQLIVSRRYRRCRC